MIDSIMDALGYAGAALDKPGRAVRGILGGHPQEALSAIPFSDTLGLTDIANRVSGQDLLKSAGLDLGDGLAGGLAGFGVEALTDPTTYLGAGLGRMVGKAADAAQVARGPRYATTAEDLTRMGKEFAPKDEVANMLARMKIDGILKSDDPAAFLREIPDKGNILGAGYEGIAFKAPEGDVARIGRMIDSSSPGRPISPDVVQPTHSTNIKYANDYSGNPVNWRSERLPLAKLFESEAAVAPERAGLVERLGGQGLELSDSGRANLANVGGKAAVLDPGSVAPLEGFSGGFSPLTARAEPGAGMDMLLRALGGDDALRAAFGAGRGSPGFDNKLMALGGLAGSIPGRFGG